jgi:hypothetical protein
MITNTAFHGKQELSEKLSHGDYKEYKDSVEILQNAL